MEIGASEHRSFPRARRRQERPDVEWPLSDTIRTALVRNSAVVLMCLTEHSSSRPFVSHGARRPAESAGRPITIEQILPAGSATVDMALLTCIATVGASGDHASAARLVTSS